MKNMVVHCFGKGVLLMKAIIRGGFLIFAQNNSHALEKVI